MQQKTVERLQQFAIRPSAQRIAIMDYLSNTKSHPTAEMIYEELHPKMPTLSLTTVYNTLSLFVQQGAALNITINSRNQRFDGDTSFHAHFLCDKCSELYDIVLGTNLENFTPETVLADFDVQTTQLYYTGVCKNCK